MRRTARKAAPQPTFTASERAEATTRYEALVRAHAATGPMLAGDFGAAVAIIAHERRGVRVLP